MRVAYLTACEDVYASGIIRSQVLPLLADLARTDGVEVTLAALVPLHRHARAGRAARAAFVRRLEPAGVAVVVAPFVGRSLVYLGPRALRGLAFQARRFIERTLGTADLVHARGYPAAHLAAQCGVPFVFDGRGLYPEEAIHTGAWRRGSPEDRFWRAEERRLVRAAAAFVGVSGAFAEIAPPAKTFVVPCFAEPAPEGIGPLPAGIAGFLAAEGPVLAYAGALTSWYTPHRTFAAFARIAERTAWRMLVLTGEGPRAELLAREAGVPPERIAIHELPAPLVPLALAGADATIWAPFDEPSRLYASQLGVKFAEYAAAGRPILVSSILTEAARLIAAYGAGVVLTSDESDVLKEALDRVAEHGDEMGRQARALHGERFTRSGAVRAYRSIYAAPTPERAR